MKRNVLFFMVMVAVVFLSGCGTTAGIPKPSIPMRQQCVIDLEKCTLDGREGGGLSVKYGEIDLIGFSIVPAGVNRILFQKTHQSIASQTRSGDTLTTVYHTWIEQWVGVFEFEPGKYYSFALKSASVVKEGTSITSSDPGISVSDNILIHQLFDTGIIEDPKKDLGAVYVGLKVGGVFAVDVYDYGPSLQMGGGPMFGVQIIKGWLNMFLGVEADVGGGLMYPRDGVGGLDWVVSYNYGAFAKIAFGPIILGVNGGMGNGHLWYSTEDNEEKSESYSSVPYAEVALGLNTDDHFRGPAGLTHNIYARYYFTDDEYNSGKVFFGFKMCF